MKRKFLRQGAMNVSRVKKNWRRPKGLHSKIRLSRNGHGFTPKIGYGSKKEEKYLIDGLMPAQINNLNDLEKLTEKNVGIIGSSIGLRKKIEIVKKAQEKGIKLLNLKDVDGFMKKVEEWKEAKKKEKAKEEKTKKEVNEEKKEEKPVETKEKPVEEKEKEDKRKVLEKGL